MASLWELRSYFTNETLNNDFDNISVDEVTSHLVRTSFRFFMLGSIICQNLHKTLFTHKFHTCKMGVIDDH